MEESIRQYMEIIDHLSTAKEMLNKTDAWIGAELYVIIEKVKRQAGDKSYTVLRKEWTDSVRIGG